MSTFALSPLANIGIIRSQKDDIASSAEASDRSLVSIWTTTEAVGFGKSLSRRQKQPDSPTRSGWKEGRGYRLVAKAGPPSNTTLIFAFVFPLSLLVITVLNAIRIADKLDEKFFEEVVCERTPERRSRGFGFVTMASTEEANEAIRMFNGSQLLGRTMKVNFPEVPRGGERAIMGPRIRRSSRAFVETPHKIYAGNLAWTVTSEGLRSAFEAQSGLVGAKVVYERDSGKSRGFGFVSFQSLEDAESALAAMNGGELEGRLLRLNLASEKIIQISPEVVDSSDDT